MGYNDTFYNIDLLSLVNHKTYKVLKDNGLVLLSDYIF